MDDPIPDKYLPKSDNYQNEIKILSEKISESKMINNECFKYRAFLFLLIGDYKSAYRDFSEAIHYGKCSIIFDLKSSHILFVIIHF